MAVDVVIEVVIECPRAAVAGGGTRMMLRNHGAPSGFAKLADRSWRARTSRTSSG